MNTPTLSEIFAHLDIYALNAMQEAALETIPAEPNVVLLAPTGSGKTLAFLLPILSLLEADRTGVQCLVLSPTRELALQIEKVWQKMATGYKVNTCYGGHSMAIEIRNLSQPPALLIGTPGRIIEHLQRESFLVNDLKVLVLDEFDKALSMGFQEQMEQIIKGIPQLERRILVSASKKQHIPKFTGVEDPKVLDFTQEEDLATDGLTLRTVMADGADKMDALFNLLCHIGNEQTLIFCNQRDATENAVAELAQRGIAATYFHGGMEQLDREKTLVQFRNGSIAYLVASDLAARGLDIPEVRHVIHLELPSKAADFLHRNGRTARMHAQGAAYVIVQPNGPVPEFLTVLPEEMTFGDSLPLPLPSPWVTLYISGGKKDKLSKTDVVGFLAKKGELQKDDIGKIELLDHMSFVAVKKNIVQALLKKVQPEKMKGKKYKIEIVR